VGRVHFGGGRVSVPRETARAHLPPRRVSRHAAGRAASALRMSSDFSYLAFPGLGTGERAWWSSVLRRCSSATQRKDPSHITLGLSSPLATVGCHAVLHAPCPAGAHSDSGSLSRVREQRPGRKARRRAHACKVGPWAKSTTQSSCLSSGKSTTQSSCFEGFVHACKVGRVRCGEQTQNAPGRHAHAPSESKPPIGSETGFPSIVMTFTACASTRMKLRACPSAA
jgi:hypothetical protein